MSVVGRSVRVWTGKGRKGEEAGPGVIPFSCLCWGGGLGVGWVLEWLIRLTNWVMD